MIHTFICSPEASGFVSAAEPRRRGACGAGLTRWDSLAGGPTAPKYGVTSLHCAVHLHFHKLQMFCIPATATWGFLSCSLQEIPERNVVKNNPNNPFPVSKDSG